MGRSSIQREELAGLVLIGGRSERMGRDKATTEIAGVPLWRRAVEILIPIVEQVFLVGSIERFNPPASLPMIADDPPGFGPLGGIATGLERSGYEHHLVLAVDYPLVQPDVLKLLLAEAPAAWAVCGRSESFLEPLVAYYHAQCAPVIRAMLAEGEIRTHRLFERVPAVVITDDEYDAVDPQRLSQINVNTPADCERVRALLQTPSTP